MKLSNQKRHWPGYLFGRIRTSTLVLIAAFLAVWWIYETYRPQAPGPGDSPPTQVVPPGFVPDPDYTWVPRTRVQPPTVKATPTTTSSTPPVSPPETTTDSAVPPPFELPPPFGPGCGSGAGGVGVVVPANLTATLACRDDHPGPCHQAVQIVGASGVG